MVTKKRKAISTKTRFDVFKRDGFTCQYCGAHPPAVVLHVDHIIPVAEGGENDKDNLITSCETCNFGKGPRSLHVIPESLAGRAALIAEQEAQIKGYAKIVNAKRARIEAESWQIADLFIAAFSLDGIRKDWFSSIKMFVDRLGVFECESAMERAISKNHYNEQKCFLYFCGTCWRIIKEVKQ